MTIRNVTTLAKDETQKPSTNMGGTQPPSQHHSTFFFTALKALLLYSL